MNLEHRHPAWKRLRLRWEMAHDFWRGGICIVDPSREVTEIGWYEETPDDGGTAAEPSPSISRRAWRTAWANSYLWKHERETINEYSMRTTRTINLPLYQYVVNTLAAGVMRSKPTRDGTAGWEQTHEDMDLQGTDVDAFMRRALSLALVFGRIHAVTDRPLYPTPALSRGEQLARGERAYARLVTPLQLVDWACDDRGRLIWAQILEPGPDIRRPGDEPRSAPPQYRIWFADHWELWTEDSDRSRGGGEKWTMIGGGSHSVGRVPISTLYATRTGEAAVMECESPLADVLDYNHYAINKHSELDEIDRMQSWSQLAIPVADGSLGNIDWGPARYITFPQEGSAPTFLSPDASLPAGKAERLDAGIHTQRQLAGIGRGRAEYSKEERSAAAISVESEDKRNQMAWWSKALQEFDQRVHADLAAWDETASVPRVAYPSNYDVKSTATAVVEVLQLASLPVIKSAPEVQAGLVRPLMRKMLGEMGLRDDEVDEIVGGLDTAIQEAKDQQAEQLEVAKAAAEAKAGPPQPAAQEKGPPDVA